MKKEIFVSPCTVLDEYGEMTTKKDRNEFVYTWHESNIDTFHFSKKERKKRGFSPTWRFLPCYQKGKKKMHGQIFRFMHIAIPDGTQEVLILTFDHDINILYMLANMARVDQYMLGMTSLNVPYNIIICRNT